MRKSTTIKIALFAFLSEMICVTGNYFLGLEVLSYVSQGLGFASYLFLMIWISQFIYSKARFGINLVTFFMSLALALYSIGLISLLPDGKLLEYYALLFYVFVMICIVSAIVFVGRVIFSSPKKKENPQMEKQTSVAVTTEGPSENSAWVCSCGCHNTGKFCSECGKPNDVESVTKTSDVSI